MVYLCLQKVFSIMALDLSKLDDWELFEYFCEKHPDRNMRDGALLLPIALHDVDKENALLRRIARTGEKFVFYYPAFDKEEPANAEYIGSIPDGGLYITSE